MPKHGELQKKLLKTITSFYHSEVLKNPDSIYEFTIKINPFIGKFAYLLIEKFKDKDAVRLVCIIHTTTKIQSILKKTTPEDRDVINARFEDLYLKHRAELIFSPDDKTLQNVRIILTQNLSLQKLLDSIQDNIILVKEAVKHLKALDDSVKPTEIDNTNTMFQ